MIFSSLQYLIFLPIVVFLYWRTTGSARLGLVVLSSYIFYMSWFPLYGVLLFFLTLANWGLALGLDSTRAKSTAQPETVGASAIPSSPQLQANSLLRKGLLIAGLLLNLGCLCYYKYTNFILSNLFAMLNWTQSSVAQWFGSSMMIPAWQAPVLKLMLPLGISFFVFEFVHYIADVYKGNKPTKSFMEFAAFASFFPSQIAGPIKRYQDFNDRLRAPEAWSTPLFFEAMTLIVQGLFKKVAIADPIAIMVWRPFSLTHLFSSTDALLTAIGFTIQVYCDFSGYTDIGRGSALLLGIRLPENFNLPYLSVDLGEFWRRWHMSLGSWLRDYIYIPLGGSRHGKVSNWRNLFITMVVCGLWHGASWHYIIFGATQGIGLVVNREWRNALDAVKPLQRALETLPGKALGVFLTMSYIVACFAVFRAPDMPQAFNMLKSMVNFHGESMLLEPLMRSGISQLLSVYMIFWLVTELAKRRPQWFGPVMLSESIKALRFSGPVRFASWTAAIILTIAARPTDAIPFVYFQF